MAPRMIVGNVHVPEEEFVCRNRMESFCVLLVQKDTRDPDATSVQVRAVDEFTEEMIDNEQVFEQRTERLTERKSERLHLRN